MTKITIFFHISELCECNMYKRKSVIKGSKIFYGTLCQIIGYSLLWMYVGVGNTIKISH